MGKMLSTDEHIEGTRAGRHLARMVTRRPDEKRWSKALFAQVVCTPSEPTLSLLPAAQAQRQVYLTRGVVERFGLGGSHALEGVAHTLTVWKIV